MVTKTGIAFFYLLLFFSTLLLADNTVYVTSEIDTYGAYENQPLKGTITVTHDQNDKIDPASFLLDNKPLQVEFKQDVKISGSVLISYYGFQLSAQAAGLYVLPEAVVKVGGKPYRSVMSSYEVQGSSGRTPSSPSSTPPPKSSSASSPASSPPQPPASPPPAPNSAPSANSTMSSTKPILRLESSIDGPKPLYPGQQAKLIYRYFFNTSFDLTKELLPLLDAKGFLKIGDKEHNDYTQGDLTVSEIYQVVQAIKPGKYSFGPSLIEGYATTQASGGKPVHSSPKISSEAPALTVTVDPFPAKDKPASFNGSVGNFNFNVSLLSPPKANVGEEIILSVEISGKGDLKAAKLPEICCQPGFSGFFRMSDLPPIGTIKDQTETFTVRLRPLTDAIKEIPNIEFSSFDPLTSEYVVKKSKPIPITLQPLKGGSIQDLDRSQKNSTAKMQPSQSTSQTSLIEIESIFSLTASDLYNKWFGTWWALAIIPFGIAFLIYLAFLRSYFDKLRIEAKRQTPYSILQEALREKKGSARYFELLNKALKLRLFQAAWIDSPDTAAENLPNTGISGEIRTFLCDIEENRYAGKGDLNLSDVEAKAQDLFDRVGRRE